MAADAERWRAVRTELERLLELAPAEREQNLLSVPPELREEVQRLLALEERTALADPPLVNLASERGSGQALEQRIGPYRLVQQRSQRAGRSHWLAARDDGEFRRLVQLVLSPAGHGDAESQRRWLGRLDHPAIARFLEGGSTGELVWFAFEHEESLPITRYAQAQGLAREERLALLVQACEAIEAGHRQLVPHGDLGPESVRVTVDGRLWIEGYRAEESDRSYGRSRDCQDLGELARQLLSDGSSLRPDSRPLDTTAILNRATARDPAQGYENVRQLGEDLRALLEHRPVRARSAGLWQRLRLTSRRRPWALLGGASLLLAWIALAGLAWASWRKASTGLRIENEQQAHWEQLAQERAAWMEASQVAHREVEQRVQELEQLAAQRSQLAEQLRASEAEEMRRTQQLEDLVTSRLNSIAHSLAVLGPNSLARRSFLEGAVELLEKNSRDLPPDLTRAGLTLVEREARTTALDELANRAQKLLGSLER